MSKRYTSLTLPANPTQPLEAATKQYVDTAVTGVSAGSSSSVAASYVLAYASVMPSNTVDTNVSVSAGGTAINVPDSALTFTAPASGRVIYSVRFNWVFAAAATNGDGEIHLRQNGVAVANTTTRVYYAGSSATPQGTASMEWLITGLTPGVSYTYSFGISVPAAGTFQVSYGGTVWGPMVVKVISPDASAVVTASPVSTTKMRRNTGLTTTSTAMIDLDPTTDVVIAAAAGDKLLVGFGGITSNTNTVAINYFDAYTLGASTVRYLSSESATALQDGVPGWRIQFGVSGQAMPVSGSVPFTVQQSDIVGGYVTFRLQWRTSIATATLNSDGPFRGMEFWAVNLKGLASISPTPTATIYKYGMD